MPREIVKRDDLPKGSQIYYFLIKDFGSKVVGIPGDQWSKSWKVPQLSYEILEGPILDVSQSRYGAGTYFPSGNPDPDIALQEYKDWENRKKALGELVTEDMSEELPMIEEIEDEGGTESPKAPSPPKNRLIDKSAVATIKEIKNGKQN